MEDTWIDKDVDLSALTYCIVEFFRKKNFGIFNEGSGETHTIVATPNKSHGIVEEIIVHVTGKPSDFTVKFEAGSRSSELVRLGIFTSTFGGGMFTLKGLKSQEALERLESEFWNYVDRVVWSLADSATKG